MQAALARTQMAEQSWRFVPRGEFDALVRAMSTMGSYVPLQSPAPSGASSCSTAMDFDAPIGAQRPQTPQRPGFYNPVTPVKEVLGELWGMDEYTFFEEKYYRGLSADVLPLALAQYQCWELHFYRLQPKFMLHVLSEALTPYS